MQRLALELHEHRQVAQAELLALVRRGSRVDQPGTVLTQRLDAVRRHLHGGGVVRGCARQDARCFDVVGGAAPCVDARQTAPDGSDAVGVLLGQRRGRPLGRTGAATRSL